MTPARFIEIGICLFGSQWRGAMAEALEISPKSLTRWLHGKAPIPDGVVLDLIDICQERSAEIMALRKMIVQDKCAAVISGVEL